MSFERDRLVGLLSLRLGFISRERLLECLADWAHTPGRPLVPLLRGRGGMTEVQAAAAEALAEARLRAGEGSESAGAPAEIREAFARLEGRAETLTVLAPSRETAPPPAAAPAPSERYVLGAELGRGGLGRVVEAFDAGLKREVAVKLVLDDLPAALSERFIREAELTARLEHPNIVPVHDFGTIPGAGCGLFLCMKRVRGRDLGKLLRAIEVREGGVAEGWTRARLLRVFQEICLGVAFAHSRGVIHRDLKPANVMIGDFGETLIVDWGLARRLGDGETERRSGAIREPNARGSETPTALTLEGEVLGTPAYMPPEQADGRLEDLDERSDVYSLGAILYEILTFRPPFEGRTPYEILEKVQSGRVTPPSSRLDRGTVRRERGADPAPPTRAAPEKVPAELEAICLKALAFEKNDRYRSAKDLHDEIQLFLEGVKAREREHAAAEEHVARGRQAIERHRLRRGEARAATEQTRRRATNVQPHEDKAALWADEDRAAQLGREAVEAFAEAHAELTLALGHERFHAEARRLRAALFWEKFLEAEASGDGREMLLARRMVEGDNDGTFDALLKGDGRLTLRTRAWRCPCLLDGRDVLSGEMEHRGFHPFSGRALDGHAGAEGVPALEPPRSVRLSVHGRGCAQEALEGADVWLWKYEEVQRLSVPVTPDGAGAGPSPPATVTGSPLDPRGPGLWLGRTPVVLRPLPMGTYLLVLARDGFEPLRLPVSIGRCADVEQDATMWRPREVPEGFLPLAGGAFGSQGDTEDPHSEPASVVAVDDVFIARHPVTCREYAEFLNALVDPSEAARRAPRESSDSGGYWPAAPYEVPTEAWLAAAAPARRAAARRLQGCPADWEEDWPVFGVSWEDAMAYAAWRRGRDGRAFTLPHEMEWEKAARGTDRRLYPWGNHFDGRWCNHNRAHPGAMRPVPIQAFPHDESPYGVRGLAGNSRDLCLNDPGSDYLGWRVVRGGNWSSSSVYVRAAMRSGYTTKAVYQSLGFRLSCLCRLPG